VTSNIPSSNVDNNKVNCTFPTAQPDRRPWLLLLSAVILLLDRLTKYWVVRHIPEGEAIVVIHHVFRITHVLNPGAAFSMFTDSSRPGLTHWLLTGFSLVAAVALILGGTIGNVWDRIRFGVVTDFLEVHIVHYHWPDFNVADSAIVIGGILLVLDALRSGPKQAGSQ
jgi:signal peptidase II